MVFSILKGHYGLLISGFKTACPFPSRAYSAEILEARVWIQGAEMQGMLVLAPFAGQFDESLRRPQTLEGVMGMGEVFRKEHPVCFRIDVA
jgi:hypothetical protein